MTWRNWHLDLLALLGLAAVVYGAALIYPPAAWIVGGAIALGAGITGALR